MEGQNRTGSTCKERLELKDKYLLTISEASEYFNIGIKSLRRLSENHVGAFTIFVGNRYLIIRKNFEEYLLNCAKNKQGRLYGYEIESLLEEVQDTK